MYLTLRVYRHEGGGGVVEFLKRKSPVCFKPIGGIVYEDEDDLRQLLKIFTQDNPGNTIQEGGEPSPPKCPLCSYRSDEH